MIENVAEALSQPKSIKLDYYEKIGLSFLDDYENRKSTKRMVWFLRDLIVYDLSHLKVGALAWFEASPESGLPIVSSCRCGIYPDVPFVEAVVEQVAMTPFLGAPDPDPAPEDGKFLDSKGRLHRKDGRPALIFKEKGKVISQTYRRGKLHSYGIAPSEIVKEDGRIIGLKWHTKGKLDRQDYPAIITYDEEGRIASEAFYVKGSLKASRMYSFGKIREAHVFMGDVERVYVYTSEGKLRDSYTKNDRGEDVGIDPKLRREKWQSRKDEFALGATVKFLEKSKQLPELLQHAPTVMNYEDIPAVVPYTSTRDLIKTSLHNGQFKLFLTELRFLTEVLDDLETRAYMIYAGSAPSNKIGRLAVMFPNVKFILVDPNEHYIMYPGIKSQYDYPGETLYFKAKSDPRFGKPYNRVTYWDGRAKQGKRSDIPNKPLPKDISDIIINEDRRFFIIEDYFSDEVATLLRPLVQKERHVYFVSDIRTQYESEESPREIDILWNSAQMYNWLKILRPKKFMLKFRCPYDFQSDVAKEYREGKFVQEAFDRCTDIPFIENHMKKKFVYIKPEVVYMQAFAGAASTESRLIASSLELEEWDATLYNDRFFYYNRIHRPYGWHDVEVMPKIGIDRCGDCAITVQTFKDYVEKYGSSETLYDLIKDTLRVCRRNLFDDSIHGYYLEKYSSVKDLVSKQMDYLEAVWAQTYRGQVLTQAIKSYTPLTCEKAKARQLLYKKYPDVADKILSLSLLVDILSQQDGHTQMYGIKQLQGLPIEDIFRDIRTPKECASEEASISLLATPPSHAFELESPELADFLKNINGKLVTLTSEDRVCGILSSLNFFQHNIFNLDCSTYIFFIQGLPFFLKLLLAERLKSTRSGHVFIEETSDPNSISNDFIRSEKIVTFPCTFIDRERVSRQSFVTARFLSSECPKAR